MNTKSQANYATELEYYRNEAARLKRENKEMSVRTIAIIALSIFSLLVNLITFVS